MIIAQHPLPPSQGVIVHGPRGGVLAERVQVPCEVAGRGQGIGVILAEHSPPPRQGVLIQSPRRGVIA